MAPWSPAKREAYWLNDAAPAAMQRDQAEWAAGHGRDVQERKPKPTRADNHWLDCLVGCAVAASMCGVKLPGADVGPRRQRKRYTQKDLRRR